MHLKSLITNTWILWVEILGPSLTSNVTLGKLLKFIKRQFPHLRVGLRIGHLSKDCCENGSRCQCSPPDPVFRGDKTYQCWLLRLEIGKWEYTAGGSVFSSAKDLARDIETLHSWEFILRKYSQRYG